MQLTLEQETIVYGTGAGRYFVQAVPGSGKTTCLGYKVKQLVEQGDVDPRRVLVLTFSRKDAGRFSTKLGELLGAKFADTIEVRTLHSFCWRRIYGNRCEPGEHLADDQIVADYLKVIDTIPFYRSLTKPLRKKLACCLAHLAATRSDVSDETIIRQYFSENLKAGQSYVDHYLARDAKEQITFDDLMLKVRENMSLIPRRGYDWLLVDEVQDLTPLQLQIVDRLADGCDGAIFVGDPNQSIYGFRHVNPEALATLIEGAKSLPLSTNFRSNAAIVSLYQQLIPSAVPIASRRGNGMVPVIKHFESEHDEAKWIAGEIRSLIENDNVPSNEIAVLFRQRGPKLEQEIAKLLSYYGIQFRQSQPYKVKSEQVDNVIAVLKVATHAADPATIVPLLQQANELVHDDQLKNLQLAPTWLDDPEVEFDDPTTQDLLSQLQSLLKEIKNEEVYRAWEVFSRLGDWWYSAFGEDLVPEAIWEDDAPIKELIDAFSHEFSSGNDNPDVAVQFNTIHAFKGDESKVIFLPKVAEKTIPFVLAKSPQEIEEEKRILYVGLSRPEDRLYVTYSHHPLETCRYQEPSRFLSELGRILEL